MKALLFIVPLLVGCGGLVEETPAPETYEPTSKWENVVVLEQGVELDHGLDELTFPPGTVTSFSTADCTVLWTESPGWAVGFEGEQCVEVTPHSTVWIVGDADASEGVVHYGRCGECP